MDTFIQDAIDAKSEAHKEGIFREECMAHKRRLEEMESILGPLPHLRKELAELSNDPKKYSLKS